MLIYVILLQSDCFKVQGHLVPRLTNSVGYICIAQKYNDETIFIKLSLVHLQLATYLNTKVNSNFLQICNFFLTIMKSDSFLITTL